MTATVWPINAVNGAPVYSGRGLRQTQVGVPLAGASATRPLGVFSGVRPGTPASTVSATSTTVTVGPFAGVLDGEPAAEAGGYEFSFDAAQSFTSSNGFVAADSSNARIDIVYVRVSDPSEADGSTVPTIETLYLAGQASGSPTAPATPARSMVIARVNVPKAGGGTPSVTWFAPVLAAAGGMVQLPTLAALQAFTGNTNQRARVYGDVAANNVDYIYDSTAGSPNWRPIRTVQIVPTTAGSTSTRQTIAPNTSIGVRSYPRKVRVYGAAIIVGVGSSSNQANLNLNVDSTSGSDIRSARVSTAQNSGAVDLVEIIPAGTARSYRLILESNNTSFTVSSSASANYSYMSIETEAV